MIHHNAITGEERWIEPWPMKVILHHSGKITEGTELALAAERYQQRTNMPPYRPDPLEIEVVRLKCVDKHDYGDFLAAHWLRGEPFINLEQDVAPWPGALTEMWNCPQRWCMVQIIVHGAINNTNLGCVKFANEFISAFPDVWKKYPRNDIFDWRSLDSWLHQFVEPAKVHIHNPPALHLNPEHLK